MLFFLGWINLRPIPVVERNLAESKGSVVTGLLIVMPSLAARPSLGLRLNKGPCNLHSTECGKECRLEAPLPRSPRRLAC